MNPKLPSRFEQMLAEGRALAGEEQAERLRELAQSRQFPALLALVRSHWEGFGRAASSQKLAAHHGCLEHCAGSMHALQLFEDQLRALVKERSK